VDLCLLTHHDKVLFEQDGIRDGESISAWMKGGLSRSWKRRGGRFW